MATKVNKLLKSVADSKRESKATLENGDRGQRFAVYARRNGGEPICIGWTEAKGGGVLANIVVIHPEWSDLRFVDRDPLEQRVRVLRRVTCRKCSGEFDAMKDRCSYCGNGFIVPSESSGLPAADPQSFCGHCGAVLADVADAHECKEREKFEGLKSERVELQRRIATGELMQDGKPVRRVKKETLEEINVEVKGKSDGRQSEEKGA